MSTRFEDVKSSMTGCEIRRDIRLGNMGIGRAFGRAINGNPKRQRREIENEKCYLPDISHIFGVVGLTKNVTVIISTVETQRRPFDIVQL